MKIKISQLQTFLNEYFIDAKYPNQRLGQAFMNTFCQHEVNPSLFYEEISFESLNKIYQNYIDFTS